MLCGGNVQVGVLPSWYKCGCNSKVRMEDCGSSHVGSIPTSHPNLKTLTAIHYLMSQHWFLPVNWSGSKTKVFADCLTRFSPRSFWGMVLFPSVLYFLRSASHSIKVVLHPTGVSGGSNPPEMIQGCERSLLFLPSGVRRFECIRSIWISMGINFRARSKISNAPDF